jgi:hypothetical protein
MRKEFEHEVSDIKIFVIERDNNIDDNTLIGFKNCEKVIIYFSS